MRRPAAGSVLAPVGAFLAGLVLAAAITGGDGGSAVPRTAPAAAERPDREGTARRLVLAAVPELPAPLATPTPSPPPRAALRPSAPAPTATPTATPAAEPTATPPPAPPATAPAPAPPPPPPAPTPAPTFDDAGSGPAFDDEGVSP